MRPYVVEFVGARGVGKSTLAKSVRNELNERGVPLDRLYTLRRRSKLALHAARIPTTFRSTLWFLRWRTVNYREFRKLQKRFNSYDFRRRLLSKRSGLHLLDEGFFQLVLTAYMKTSRRDFQAVFYELSRLVPLPDTVVFVSAPYPTIVQRRRQRGNAGDLRKLHVSDRGLDALHQLERFLATSAKSLPQIRFLEAENSDLDSLRANSREIADAVTRGFLGIDRPAEQNPGSPENSKPRYPTANTAE